MTKNRPAAGGSAPQTPLVSGGDLITEDFLTQTRFPN